MAAPEKSVAREHGALQSASTSTNDGATHVGLVDGQEVDVLATVTSERVTPNGAAYETNFVRFRSTGEERWVARLGNTDPRLETEFFGDKPAPAERFFEALFGFEEVLEGGDKAQNFERVQQHFDVLGDRENPGHQKLRSRANGETYDVGLFENPSLAELRARRPCPSESVDLTRMTFSIVGGDIAKRHALPENNHATIQVASQVNCLEMNSESRTPEDGISVYMKDNTQGPACSLAAAPATVYRNYFVHVDPNSSTREKDCTHCGTSSEAIAQRLGCGANATTRGQREAWQVNNFRGMEEYLEAHMGHVKDPYFRIQNGYCLAWRSADGTRVPLLTAAVDWMKQKLDMDALGGQVRVGVHRDVEVTGAGSQGGDRPQTEALKRAIGIRFLNEDQRDRFLPDLVNVKNKEGTKRITVFDPKQWEKCSKGCSLAGERGRKQKAIHPFIRVGTLLSEKSNSDGSFVYMVEGIHDKVWPLHVEQRVTQVFCSGLPIYIQSDRKCEKDDMELICRVVLESIYESTFLAALENRHRHQDAPGASKVFLTSVGVGAFNNPPEWVADAIVKAILKLKDEALDVYLVAGKEGVGALVEERLAEKLGADGIQLIMPVMKASPLVETEMGKSQGKGKTSGKPRLAPSKGKGKPTSRNNEQPENTDSSR